MVFPTEESDHVLSEFEQKSPIHLVEVIIQHSEQIQKWAFAQGYLERDIPQSWILADEKGAEYQDALLLWSKTGGKRPEPIDFIDQTRFKNPPDRSIFIPKQELIGLVQKLPHQMEGPVIRMINALTGEEENTGITFTPADIKVFSEEEKYPTDTVNFTFKGIDTTRMTLQRLRQTGHTYGNHRSYYCGLKTEILLPPHDRFHDDDYVRLLDMIYKFIPPEWTP